MKRFLKQIILLVLAIIAIAILRHHAPPILPMPAQQYVHGSEIQIPVTMAAPPQTNAPTWDLVQMPNHKYEVFVRYKAALKGKFDAAKQISSNASGKNFIAVGKIQFGTQMFNASEIHVNLDGRSGYIVFKKTSAQPPGS